VPYYDTLKTVQANIHKTTSCREHNLHDPISEHQLMKFQRSDGMVTFSQERIFSDKGFRLGYALHEAGVSRSQYAREAVRQLIPREKERTTGIVPY